MGILDGATFDPQGSLGWLGALLNAAGQGASGVTPAPPTFDQRFAQAPTALSTAGGNAMLPSPLPPSLLSMAGGGAMLSPQAQAAPSFPTMSGSAGFGAGADMAPQGAALPANAAPALGQGFPSLQGSPPQQAPQPQQNPFAALFGGGSPSQSASPPGPGLMDRLTAGATNFTTGGNPIAGIMNSISGLVTGQRTDQAGIASAQIMSTYHALVSAGVQPGVAQAAAMNPAVLKELLPSIYSKPTFQKTGTDPITGQDTGVWLRPDTMQVTPAVQNGAPVGPASATASPASAPGMPAGAGQMQQIADAVRSGASGEQFLSALPPAFAAQVKQIADGRAPYPSGFMLKTGYGQMLTQALAAYRPDMTAQDYTTKLATEKAFDVGVPGTALKSANQAILHAQTLEPLIDQLGNHTYLPAVTNDLIHQPIASQFDPKYQSTLAQFRTTVNALASELTKAFRGNSGAIQDVEHWRKTMSETGSPEALHGGLQSAMTLLGGAIDSLGEQYNRGTRSNREPIELLDPKNRAIFERLRGGGQAAPAQAALTAQDQQALAWANQHPNDPRAAQIKQMHGVQ